MFVEKLSWGQPSTQDPWGQPTAQGATASAESDNQPKLLLKSSSPPKSTVNTPKSPADTLNADTEANQQDSPDKDGTKAKSSADHTSDMEVEILISDANDQDSTGEKAISKPIDRLHNPPPPFAQFSNKYPKSKSAPQSPITIQSQSSDSISLPTAGSVNAFHLMKMAKQNVKPKEKNKKKGGRSSSVTGPIPGINMIKSPTLQANKQATKSLDSPKRTREQMEGKDELKDKNDE